MKRRLIACLTVWLLCAAAAPARADWVLTPFAGITFGSDVPDGQAGFGASLAGMGAGAFGVEFDFYYAPDILDFGPTHATTAMANLVVGIPIGGSQGGGIRPYASGGIGMIRTGETTDVLFTRLPASNDLGLNLGAGVMGFVSDHVGLRADLRFFRALKDEQPGAGLNIEVENFDFWRGTVGAAFRF